MKEKITLCGDNCLACPRYNAKSSDELRHTAELWYRIGWRDRIVSDDEIKCGGCSSHKQCTYKLVDCVKEHNIEKCSQCPQFPCDKINDMLVRSDAYRRICARICTPDEYAELSKAFFEKENNLKK